MTPNGMAAWPEGVIARYLTVGGATVDITEQPGQDAPVATVAICSGCGQQEVTDWVMQAWSHFSNQYVEEVDEGGQRSTPKACEWAQAHAEKCRALPRPDGGAR